MQIEVVNISTEESVGTYKQFEIVYRDGSPGVKSKKLVSFSAPEVYNTLKNASKGDTFEIATEKNGKYVNWVSASPKGKVDTSEVPQRKTAEPAPKGNWETAEERNANRVKIIRQSSLNYATQLVGPKGDINKVFEYAAQFEQWINRSDSPTGVQALIEMPDDLVD